MAIKNGVVVHNHFKLYLILKSFSHFLMFCLNFDSEKLLTAVSLEHLHHVTETSVARLCNKSHIFVLSACNQRLVLSFVLPACSQFVKF